jgi:5'-nucleotidase
MAFTSVGEGRASLRDGPLTHGEQPRAITYEEAHRVRPFGNRRVSVDLTGDPLRQLREQQYQPVPARGSRSRRALGVSHGFSDAWDATQPQGSRVVGSPLHHRPPQQSPPSPDALKALYE